MICDYAKLFLSWSKLVSLYLRLEIVDYILKDMEITYFSSSVGSINFTSSVVRKYFPETWIFDSIDDSGFVWQLSRNEYVLVQGSGRILNFLLLSSVW